ncbi:MAG: AbrB/MazE/SpoVT family DNA-binding domain-containing protein [Candidatus Solibacter sp.]
MSKVTSKYQVTVPRAIADQYGISPGTEIDWQPAGDSIRVTLSASRPPTDDVESRLRLFDQATERIRRRRTATKVRQPKDRGWRREDLYTRGNSR